MLSKKSIRTIVNYSMERYAVNNDGRRGVLASDIYECIKDFNGEKEDLYKAIQLSSKRLLGRKSIKSMKSFIGI